MGVLAQWQKNNPRLNWRVHRMTSELQYQRPVKKENWQMDKHSAGIIAVQYRNKDRYLPKGGGIAVDKSLILLLAGLL